ncbi:MAG: hypothetical protein WD267_01230 [Balneolales bacterium]
MAKKVIKNIDTRGKALDHIRENAPEIFKKHHIHENSPDVHITTAAQHAGFIYRWRGDLFRSFEVLDEGDPMPFQALETVDHVTTPDQAREHLRSLYDGKTIPIRGSGNNYRVWIHSIRKVHELEWAASELGYIYPNLEEEQ